MVIYKILNTKNSKVYIGQAVDFDRRKIRHLSELRNKAHNNSHLSRSFEKYGEEAFVFSIVEDGISSRERLNEREIYWINFYQSHLRQYGYNLMLGGDAKLYIREETRQKISKAHSGRKQSSEWIEKRASKLRGRKLSNEEKKKCSERTSKKISEGWKPDISGFIIGGRKGSKHSDEAREKMKAFHTGKSWEEKWGTERAKKKKEQQKLRFTGANNPIYKEFDSEQALSLLLNSQLTIEEIASKLGMSKPSFYTKFKTLYGTTPNEYRRKNQT